MKDGKLFYLLKNLSPEEFKGLKKAVYSPFFTTNKRIQLLYEALKPAYPNFEDSKKYRQKLFKKVFPEAKFDNHKQLKLHSAFCILVEEYIQNLYLRKQNFKRKQLRIDIYKERQLEALFVQETKALKAQLETAPYRDLEHYQAQIFLNEVLYFNPLKDKYDTKDVSLDNLVNGLDHYFALAKMRYGISVKSRENILAKPGIWRFTGAMKKETDFMDGSVLFQLYQMAFSLLEEEEGFSFEEYEKLLFKHIDAFRYDAKVLFFSGLNYVVRLVNNGNSDFSKKAFEWHRFGLEKGVFLENGKLSAVVFGNIVIYGCREKEFRWTEEFMKKNSKYLEEAVRQDVMMYHLGLWNFYQEDYSAVLSVYFNYQFSQAYISKTRITTIRALFELFLIERNYFDLLISTINAHEVFITRDKKFANEKWIPHLNCIRILKKSSTMILDNKSGEQVHRWIRKEMMDKQKIVVKQWLVEKSEQIRKII